MMITFSQLARFICSGQQPGWAYLVGIDGRSASGKSTFSERLGEAIAALGSPYSIIPMDDLFSPDVYEKEAATSLNPGFDMGWIRSEIIDPLKNGEAVRFQRYDKLTKTMDGWRDIPGKAIIILEGVFTTGRLLGDAHNLRIWLDCPRETLLDRADEREGPGARTVWETKWLPAEDAYIAREKPDSTADLTVDGACKDEADAFRPVLIRNPLLKNLPQG